MTPLNVYDAVNRERLLGTHPRWKFMGDGDYCKFITCPRPVCVYDGIPNSFPRNISLSVNHVELQRAVIRSKDGWSAEVALVTYSPLEHLMQLKDFRLPNEADCGAERRRDMY